MTTAKVDARHIAVSAEHAQILEDVCTEMVRDNDERAVALMTLALSYKFAKPVSPMGDIGINWSQESHSVPLTLIHGDRDDAS